MSDWWFPRPGRPEDVRLVDREGHLTATEIHRLLKSPASIEWTERVGVVGKTDGSAKASTRLLRVEGWVAKLDLERRFDSPETLLEALEQARAPLLRVSVWSPEKQWAMLRGAEGWWLLTLCPELTTIRQFTTLERRMSGWTALLAMGLRVSREFGVGLDLNPANFGERQLEGPLFYIDDESYPALTAAELAGAIVARIPEEPGCPVVGWRQWGEHLVAALSRASEGRLDWGTLYDELGSYPLTQRFEAARRALLEPFAAARIASKRAPRSERRTARRTCVFADVHANLPALEAVLEAAADAGAHDYLFLGDAVGYGPHPRQCIERLAELPRALLLRGNHDHAIATGHYGVGMNRLARLCAEWTSTQLDESETQWLANLAIEHQGEDWVAVHGAPRDPRRFLAYVYELTYEDNLDWLRAHALPLCFYGHTHVQCAYVGSDTGGRAATKQPRLELTRYTRALVNPGSVGQPRDGDARAAFALWDHRERSLSFQRVGYDVEATLRALRVHGLPEELQQRLHAGT